MRTTFLLLALAVASADAANATPAPLPPDPRRGERLDGRAPPADAEPLGRRAARLALAIPRYGARLVLFPVVKAGELVEEHSLYERLYWAVTAEDRLSGLRPELRYATGFRPQVGLRYFDRRTLGPGSLMEARFRTAGPSLLVTQLALRPSAAWGLRTRFEETDDRQFAGVRGLTADELDRPGTVARYGYQRALGEVDGRVALSGRLALAVRGAVDVHDFKDGRAEDGDLPISQVYCSDCAAGIIDEARVPGFGDGSRRFQAGATLELDTRTRPRFGSGVTASMDLAWNRGVASDASHDLGWLADGRAHVDLDDRSLVVGGVAGGVEKLGDVPVPFEHLVVASGAHRVRGLETGILRGQSLLVGTAEYRWLVHPLVDASLFADYGGAFGRWFDGLETDRMHPTYGLGLRLLARGERYWLRRPIGSLELAVRPGEELLVLFTVED